MKLTSTLLALAGVAMLTGCDPAPGLLSLERVATAQETAIDAALAGAWLSPSDQDTRCIIRQDDHNGYQITYLAGSTAVNFQAQLFRAGDAEFLDVTPADDNDFRVPGHAIARVWPDGSTLRWAFLDSDWLKQQARVLLTHDADGKMLLLSPASAVRAFIDKLGTDDKAYGQMATWQRLQ